MLGLDWTELALIAVVAVVVIGPKDLPDAVRGIARGMQKLRRMAGEFQGQVDEVVREAKLEGVRDQINDIRNFRVRDIVEKEVDADGSLRRAFSEDPLREAFQDTGTHGAVVTPAPASPFMPDPLATDPPAAEAPAFIPPGTAAPVAAWTPPAPPAFVPPPAAAAGPSVPPPPAAT